MVPDLHNLSLSPQYPALYIGSDISADVPEEAKGQNNTKMYIMNSFVADFSTLPNPDEFDEDFGSGYSHYAANPALGASYASYIRDNAVLGYPLTDSEHAAIDTEENNRRIFSALHACLTTWYDNGKHIHRIQNQMPGLCRRDATTGETYSDWRMPTQAEIYLIDVLQNIRICEVKGILEGNYYWSSNASGAVNFMDPARVGEGGKFSPLNASVRCVRDIR